MEVQSVTYHGWQDGLKTVEKRSTYKYEQGNDVTVVERRSYIVEVYDARGSVTQVSKGTVIDQMV